MQLIYSRLTLNTLRGYNAAAYS